MTVAGRRRRPLITRPGAGLAIAVASLAGIALVTLLVVVPSLGGTVDPAAYPSAPVEPSPGQEAPAQTAVSAADESEFVPLETRRQQPLEPGQPVRLSIPRLGLDANVGAMTVPDDGRVNPPTPGSAYWMRGYGAAGPASANTVYLAGHTYRKGSAVFDPLLDVPRSAVAIVEGDEMEVQTPEATYRYVVEQTAVVDKTRIGDESELWRRVPGRLVLITCFQYDGGTSSTQNVLVYAQLDER